MSFDFTTSPSLVSAQGVVFTMARTGTSRTFTDPDSMIRKCLANEAVFDGWRRVENLFTTTATLSTQNVTVVAQDYTVSFTGTGTITFSGTGANGNSPLVGQGAATRVAKTITCAAGTLTCTVSGSVTLAQIEHVHDQSNKAPADYVSKGTLSTPFHGCGVDGVNYFNTTNGNSIASEVVTEAAGTAITVRGLSIYESATNRVIQSDNFAVTWTAIGTPTITAAAASCGIVPLALVGDDDALVLEGYKQTVGLALSNQPRGISFFFKKGTSTSTAVRLYDSTAAAVRLLAVLTWSGATPSIAMTTGTLNKIETLGNGVFRAHMRSTTIVFGNTNELEVYPATNAALDATATGDIYLGGFQAEDHVGSVREGVTPYVPTTTAAVARPADNCGIGGAPAWLNTIEGCFVVQFACQVAFPAGAPAYSQYIVHCYGTTTDRMLINRQSGDPAIYMRTGNVEQISESSDVLTGSPLADDTVARVSYGYKTNDAAGSMNGNALQTDDACTLPPAGDLNGIYLGSLVGETSIDGYIQKFDYYSYKPANATIQTLATYP